MVKMKTCNEGLLNTGWWPWSVRIFFTHALSRITGPGQAARRVNVGLELSARHST
jgi:hypothetical protein